MLPIHYAELHTGWQLASLTLPQQALLNILYLTWQNNEMLVWPVMRNTIKLDVHQLRAYQNGAQSVFV